MSVPDKQKGLAEGYPMITFDVDKDITEAALSACTNHIQDSFYEGLAHGVELVIDKKSGYFNASTVVSDDSRLDALLKSDVMKTNFEYIKTSFGKDPFYHVVGKDNKRLNGVYMHCLAIGNVIGNRSVRIQ